MSAETAHPAVIANRFKSYLDLNWLGGLLYLLAVLAPLGALLFHFHDDLRADWFTLLVPQGRRLTLWLQSVSLAAAVAAAGMVLGVLIALKLWGWRKGPWSHLRWLFLIMVPIPPFIHAMAWSSLVFRLNSAMRPLGLAEIPFRGWGASWWVQTLSLLPIAIALALAGLESVNPELIEAARLLRPDLAGLMRIILPLAAPTILAGGGLLFLLSLVDYTIPSLFQMQVYALDIFADFSAHNQPSRALLVSVPLLITTVAAVLFSQAKLRPAALDPNWQQRFPNAEPHWPNAFQWLQKGALMMLVLQAAVPLVILLLLAGSWKHLAEAAASAQSEIIYSLQVALGAALLGLPMAYGVARLAQNGRRDSWFWWLAMTLPLAVPGPLVGIGLIALWNRLDWLGVYGSNWMPVLAATARFTPLATIILLATLRRLNPALIEAARLLETGRWRSWWWVQIPMVTPGLLAAAGLTFCLVLGELSATLLVVPPGQATLTIRIYNFLHYGATDTVAGLCLLLTATVLLFGGLAVLSLALWSQLTNGRDQLAGRQTEA